MQKSDRLIRTKLRLPFTRPELVSRLRLQEQMAHGLRGPLTLITAPAGFGKTTLVASYISNCGLPMAWLSLDQDDNQAEHFLSYLVAALQAADPEIGKEAVQFLASLQQAPLEAVLTSLINDLDTTGKEIVLVLDDYQFISSQAVHEAVAFLLEHCPKTFHLVIATRSDPPLPLARWRARGHTVELRAADLSFTESDAAQFLNEVMGLRLDTGSVAALAGRTEGWIAGLQMASIALQAHLSMRDREDVNGFIKSFSGTNRYIMDYLLEEVLASQPPEIQRFLLYTSILDRLTAPLCDIVINPLESSNVSTLSPIEVGEMSRLRDQRFNQLTFTGSTEILEYLERANLFLVPLDDERIWYRYHSLFSDLLRTQLHKSLGAQGVAQLHIRAAEWHAQNGSILEAIKHASQASDDERVERFIEQHYLEMVSRGEQSGMRFWTGKLSKGVVYRRPWLCIYEALSHSWYGELDEANRLLEQAKKLIQTEVSTPDAQSMQCLHAYVKSRVTAMRGDIPRAIEYCLTARECVPSSNLALQLDTRITLGYEYFLVGDYAQASQVLNETIQSGLASGAVINTVAAACVLARLYAVQGQLHKSYDTYQIAAQSIPDVSGEHLGSKALVEVGIADVLCERNDLGAALAHVKQGLALLPMWDKGDDWALAYLTLARIHLAQANREEAEEALEKAVYFIHTRGVFSEARQAVEIAQVKRWLAQGDLQAANRWAASSYEKTFAVENPFRFLDELAQITRARVFMAQNKLDDAISLLSQQEKIARTYGRLGRVIEILLLKAFALQEVGNSEHALLALTECLKLAEPDSFVRIFLDEGPPMRLLLAQWLAHEQAQGQARADANPLRDYAIRLLSQFDTEPYSILAVPAKASPAGLPTTGPGQALVEPLSERELEVLYLISLGKTNQEIARQLVVAPGTIKAHTASIYRKLDVANRTEAVARARQFGILT